MSKANEIRIENDYKPTKKGIEFHSSNNFIKVLVGGYGSGKTRMAVEELLQLLLENQGMRIGVFRKTMQSLNDTTLHEFLGMLPDEVGDFNKNNNTFTSINGSECIFRGLDKPSKMKSLNLAAVIIDEADEITREDFNTLLSRVRQKRKDGQDYPYVIILILNPVEETHWIYELCTKEHQKYDKQGGLLELHLSSYDNKENLPDDYIPNLEATLSADEIKMMINGEWGRINRGMGVYSDAFSLQLHVKDIPYKPGMMIIRGWDFGVKRPACVVCIKDTYGRKNIYREILGRDEYLDHFAPRVLQMCDGLFGKNYPTIDYCDPRGHDRNDTGRTSVDVLNEFGVYPIGERGMRAYVDPGIRMVRSELQTLVAGQPKLTVSPEAKIVINAMNGGYVYDDRGEVVKDGYFDHLMDAYRYVAYQDSTNDAVKDAIRTRSQKKRVIRNAHTGY